MQTQAQPQAPKPDIAFVGIDMPYDSDGIAYNKLTAIDKISHLTNKITAICNDLKAKETSGVLAPNSMWIVAWREHGISESAKIPATNAISKDELDKFKSEMQALTDRFPQLRIIAGTVKTQRDIPPQSAPKKLAAINARYNELSELKKMEIDSESTSQIERHLHTAQAMHAAGNINDAKVIRNTCFVFPGNQKRSKTTPHTETDESITPHNVFHPGRFDNCLFTLAHPNGKDNFDIGVEICREHRFDVLKQSGSPIPFMHLVLSNYIPGRPWQCKSEHFIQIDSCKSVKYFANDSKAAAAQLCVYRANNDARSLALTPLIPENLYEETIIFRKFDENYILSHLDQINVLCGSEKETALHAALKGNMQNIIPFLLANGADPNIQDVYGNTAAHIAAMNYPDNIGLLQLLEQHKAKFDIRNYAGTTALDYLKKHMNPHNREAYNNINAFIENYIANHSNKIKKPRTPDNDPEDAQPAAKKPKLDKDHTGVASMKL